MLEIYAQNECFSPLRRPSPPSLGKLARAGVSLRKYRHQWVFQAHENYMSYLQMDVLCTAKCTSEQLPDHRQPRCNSNSKCYIQNCGAIRQNYPTNTQIVCKQMPSSACNLPLTQPINWQNRQNNRILNKSKLTNPVNVRSISQYFLATPVGGFNDLLKRTDVTINTNQIHPLSRFATKVIPTSSSNFFNKRRYNYQEIRLKRLSNVSAISTEQLFNNPDRFKSQQEYSTGSSTNSLSTSSTTSFSSAASGQLTKADFLPLICYRKKQSRLSLNVDPNCISVCFDNQNLKNKEALKKCKSSIDLTDSQFNEVSPEQNNDWAQIENQYVLRTWMSKDDSNLNNHNRYQFIPWFYGEITRRDAEIKLSNCTDGSFLVRNSESVRGQFSLTLRFENRIYHYRITKDNFDQYYINNDKRFLTLEKLIDNHIDNADGLVCTLSPFLESLIKNDISSDDLNISTLKLQQPRPLEIKRQNLILKEKLGGGQYGEVFEAVWIEKSIIVAIKTLREESTMSIEDFLSEAALMQVLKHPNLVRLFGVCSTEAPYFIISEYMAKGNLTEYLKNEKPDITVLMQIIIQILSAMSYLEFHHLIHRDLAARNCLVGEDNIVKVADFGLARILREDHYDAKSGSKFPIKWTAPEGLAYNRFSNKSDVWSFSILLWEIMSYGAAPYAGINLNDVYQLLSNGYRMSVPVNCPKCISKIMKKCWDWLPNKRPTFEELKTEFTQLSKLYRKQHDTNFKGKPKFRNSSSGASHISSNDKVIHMVNCIQTNLKTNQKIFQQKKTLSEDCLQDRKAATLKNLQNILGEQCNLTTRKSSLNDKIQSGMIPVKTFNLVKSKTKQDMNLYPSNTYLKRTEQPTSLKDTETVTNITEAVQSKLDIKSADESGYYEYDFKSSNLTTKEIINKLEDLRKMIRKTASLTSAKLMHISIIAEETARNIYMHLERIDSAPLRFRLRENLEIMQEMLSKLVQKKQNVNEEITSCISSSTCSSTSQVDIQTDDPLDDVKINKPACIGIEHSDDEFEQTDWILKYLIAIFLSIDHNTKA
ncbi:hypothetical protein GJ496_011701 [Pomphorhynchus laevis]|nr:hypothetical protein GJ496_011701 [Pomphorhynchus laevis]